jgi:hypothetical protein
MALYYLGEWQWHIGEDTTPMRDVSSRKLTTTPLEIEADGDELQLILDTIENIPLPPAGARVGSMVWRSLPIHPRKHSQQPQGRAVKKPFTLFLSRDRISYHWMGVQRWLMLDGTQLSVID